MARRRHRKSPWRWVLLAAVAILLAVGGWVASELRPVSSGKPFYYRVEAPTALPALLVTLQQKGVIRNATILGWLSQIQSRSGTVRIGTFQLARSMSGPRVLLALENRIRQMVRIPETNWAARTSRILARNQVCTATAYMDCVLNPARFQALVPFPLPADSLEGYLYPDTYDLPPLLGAEGVIARQLLNFQTKVWEPMHQPRDLAELVTMGSLIEMEVKRDDERPRVSAVIHNRIKLKMRIQIDAAINYGLQKWRPLTLNDYKKVDSPYNLYLHDGLPPTPICSPTYESVLAAANPTTEKSVYYVALPSGESLFAVTFEEHQKNRRLRRAALDAMKMTNP